MPPNTSLHPTRYGRLRQPPRASELKRQAASLMAGRLSATMTLREFENGYWYLDDLKDFASQIGIPAATRLRKDELERAIGVPQSREERYAFGRDCRLGRTKEYGYAEELRFVGAGAKEARQGE
jgi:hypothetical protein